jgi:AcrR family transcriptional regulator
MSDTDQTPGIVEVPRSSTARGAGGSKAALLQAAQLLFGQRGFDGTTIRDIGERAGVDAALIARYFGSKADLYIAAVAAEDDGERRPKDFHSLREMAEALVERADERGPGPILQAVVRSDTSDEIRGAALDRLALRLVDPLVAEMKANGVDRPQLRAELAVSALFGVGLGRALGWFQDIKSVPRDELVELIDSALRVITGDTSTST